MPKKNTRRATDGLTKNEFHKVEKLLWDFVVLSGAASETFVDELDDGIEQSPEFYALVNFLFWLDENRCDLD